MATARLITQHSAARVLCSAHCPPLHIFYGETMVCNIWNSTRRAVEMLICILLLHMISMSA
eukprot:5743745-Amphidinium_carterae.1